MKQDEIDIIDRNDPLFLASLDIDGDLSAPERAQLEKALKGSPSLREQAAQLRTVAKWMDSYRKYELHIDWKTHENLVLAAIGEHDSGLACVDRALKKWAKSEPDYDERVFVNGVLSRIDSARRTKRTAWRTVARLGAPLAAAAAVVLAVTATWQAPVRMSPVVDVRIGPVGEGAPIDETVVSFARPSQSFSPDAADGSIGYMTLGSSPNSSTWEESPL